MITRAAPAMGALIYGAAAEVLGLQIPVLIGVTICLAMWGRTWLGLGAWPRHWKASKSRLNNLERKPRLCYEAILILFFH